MILTVLIFGCITSCGKDIKTYTGTFPAADCPGITMTLQLAADHTFRSTLEYQERDPITTLREQGRWEATRNIMILTTHDQPDGAYFLRQLDAKRLQLVDQNGIPLYRSTDDPIGILSRK